MTLINADTGEVVSGGLVIAPQPTSLAQVDGQCAAIESWAEQCTSIPDLQDATNKLAAIDEYLNRTSVEGRGRVASAMRRLEVRIGKLLGPAENGGDRKSDQFRRDGTDRGEDLSRHQRTEFRQMAENEEEVEAVIAESTDDKPASRRSVIDRIKAARDKHPAPTKSGKSQAEVEARVAKAKEMAAEGYTSRQIADALGYTSGWFSRFRKDHEIDVPADAVIGRSRRPDSNRIVTESVQTLEGLVMGLDLVDFDDLDLAQIDDWATSLNDSLRTLNKFSKRIKEMTQ